MSWDLWSYPLRFVVISLNSCDILTGGSVNIFYLKSVSVSAVWKCKHFKQWTEENVYICFNKYNDTNAAPPLWTQKRIKPSHSMDIAETRTHWAKTMLEILLWKQSHQCSDMAVRFSSMFCNAVRVDGKYYGCGWTGQTAHLMVSRTVIS